MPWFFGALAMLAGSGMAALLLGRRGPVALWLAAGGTGVGCALGLVPAVRVLLGAPVPSVYAAWNVPWGALALTIDPLSAFFLIPIFAVSGLAVMYGAGSLVHAATGRRLGPPACFFNVLVASMAVVVTARNAVLFLVAWEVMALASYFLVTFEDEQEDVRRAGWIYLVATHAGTACLMALFLLLGPAAGGLDFAVLHATPATAGIAFGLALVGFGAKSGLVPFHVWLPEAHSAAPSHVSAVLSGVMITTGIYGLLRMLAALGPPPPWWGWALCASGVLSGLVGVLFALAQHDLKRALAYSTVDNAGVILLGLGVGLLGLGGRLPVLAALGLAGALLHVLNHALFKSLLFLGAGAVAHATGTRRLDRLGGLLRRMPWTGASMAAGAVALAALPPLNGLAGEVLIYLALLRGLAAGETALAAGVAGLALIGGLAAAGSARAFGIAFLGAPRSDDAAGAHEVGVAMCVPLVALAAACGGAALGAPCLLRLIEPVVAQLAGPAVATGPVVAETRAVGGWTAALSATLLLLAGLIAAVRRWLLVGRAVGGVTWDCGYAAPSPRMQYTASSFAEPLTTLFAAVLQPHVRLRRPAGLFPRAALLETDTPDRCSAALYAPLFAAAARGLGMLRWLQHGRVQLYVLYLVLTLMVLLVWRLG